MLPYQGNSDTVSSHFWVCAYPFVDSSIFIVPPAVIEPSQNESFRTEMKLFDADGALANELAYEFPRNRVGVIETETIMGSCKLESGIKHGHIVLTSTKGTSHYSRLHTREGAAFMGEPQVFGPDRSTFFPMALDEGRSYFLVVLNYSDVPASLKCRLFCAKRSPETMISVPGMGARILSMDNAFSDYPAQEVARQLQAYLRLSTKSNATVAVQLLERVELKKDGCVFQAVS